MLRTMPQRIHRGQLPLVLPAPEKGRSGKYDMLGRSTRGLSIWYPAKSTRHVGFRYSAYIRTMKTHMAGGLTGKISSYPAIRREKGRSGSRLDLDEISMI